MDQKIAIGLVTFNPNENLLSRLSLATQSDFRIYIFDNSPENNLVKDYCKNLSNCNYLTCGKNVGLGFGISSVCSNAYYDGNSALVFFDQDTGFNIDTLEFINEFYISKKNELTTYSSVVFNSKKINSINSNNKFTVSDTLMSINSGSLYLLENLNRLNWFNQTYFVDCVDYEFCLRSNNFNLKIGECSYTPGFDHITEQADVKYKIFGKEVMMRKYSSQRFFGTILSSIRIFFSSIKTQNNRFAIAILRSLIIYLSFQLIVRIVNIFNNSNDK